MSEVHELELVPDKDKMIGQCLVRIIASFFSYNNSF